MAAPLRTREPPEHRAPPAREHRLGRWWWIALAVLVTSALVGAGLFATLDRPPVPDGDAAPAPDVPAPDVVEELDGPDEPEPDGGPVPDHGDEPRAVWDVTGVAANDVLNVRRGPGTTFPVIGTLASDAVGLESTGRTAQVDGALWRELAVPGATTGWVNAAFLTEHRSVPAPQPPATPDDAPASRLPDSLVGAEWERVPTTEKVVALTFDAGANADGVPSILRTLEATGTSATFFLTGRWTEDHPDLARRIAQGYPVGNHSDTHPDFTDLTDAQLRAEVTAAERAIEAATDRSPRPLFRFPFGDRDARTIRLVNEAGYGSFRWTVDTLGWKGSTGGMTASAVVERVVDTVGPGQIVLLHVGSHPTDGSTLDADALPRIIEQLRGRGYRFITLHESLAIADG
jgi:peptidoglycan/xylan/chitin deacetylase (PgdA/CDA1 family)